MKRRYKLILAYDGTAYVGWQWQENGLSIQQVLAGALEKTCGQAVKPFAAGRTDAGVHALGQLAHVDLAWRHSTADLKHALNDILPEDIQVLRVDSVSPDFHAQNDALGKRYRYTIFQGELPPLFFRRYAWWVPRPLDVSAMQAAAELFVGEHDFTSFQAAGSRIKNAVRHLQTVTIATANYCAGPVIAAGPVADQTFGQPRFTLGHAQRFARATRRFNKTRPAPPIATVDSSIAGDGRFPLWQDPRNFIIFDFVANGFLKQMVRNMVGTLVEVGWGKMAPQEITEILAVKDRTKAGPTAPPQGLQLLEVYYGPSPAGGGSSSS